MVRLYKRGIAGLEYWEAWADAAGTLLVHRGRVGERGTAESLAPCAVDPGERLAALVASRRRLGFREPEMCELGLVLVQWPTDRPSVLRPTAEAWMCEVLGWTGLGGYVGFDDSSGLTIMGESVDPELAADVLSAGLEGSELPDDAVIAVCADEDVILWPPDRRGEPFDAP